jgi:DNA-binding HxlR family transcriptional regulator
MKRGFSEWPCSLARAVEVFGDSWTLLIVRDGLQGLTRFDEFQRSLNVARNTLSDRLGKLVDAGVMTKRFYQDNPPRYEYLLTEMGSQVVCSECGEPVVHADIEFCVGPGYPDDVSPELDIRGRLAPAPGQSAEYSVRDAKSSPATAGEVPEGSAPGGSGDVDGVGKDTRANGGEVPSRKRTTPKRTRPAQPSRRAG